MSFTNRAVFERFPTIPPVPASARRTAHPCWVHETISTKDAPMPYHSSDGDIVDVQLSKRPPSYPSDALWTASLPERPRSRPWGVYAVCVLGGGLALTVLVAWGRIAGWIFWP